MAKVQIERLTKTFPGRPPVVAADGLELDIEDGEFLVLLGPSGCGKTTTLRCLAGLEDPDEGRVLLDGTPVFDSDRGVNLTPDRRSIGMVFQSYALWPHLTVRKNIEYPLKARKLKEGLTGDWVGDVARLVECENLLDRLPSQLSGGQQQRIALARGLVARPGLMLFDEPLSNLDAKLRDQVRSQLHELHRRLDFTAVFVTHDQSEAFALADRIVILRKGVIEQVATARQVWHAPASDYVADFIGMANRMDLTRHAGGWEMAGANLTGSPLPVDPSHDRVSARLRPRDLAVVPVSCTPARGEVGLNGTFVDATFAGSHLDVTVDVDGHRLLAHATLGRGVSWADELDAGAPVLLTFPASEARYFTVDSGEPAAAVPPAPKAEPPTPSTASPGLQSFDGAR